MLAQPQYRIWLVEKQGKIMKNELMCIGMPTESEFQLLQTLSKTASMSGLYNGVGGPEKIFMVLLAARELGIPPLQAINGGIWNIQGKIEISARLMNSMIRRQGHSIRVVECNSQICILEGKRCDNGDSFSAQFSIEDAAKAGLAGRSTWKSYAEDMLYSRAMSRLARRLFSDVIGTAYVEGEIRDCKPEKMVPEPVEVIVEDDVKIEALLNELCSGYPDESDVLICTYMRKYASHWKKSMGEALNDYRDSEKFMRDFGRWKDKEEKKVA